MGAGEGEGEGLRVTGHPTGLRGFIGFRTLCRVAAHAGPALAGEGDQERRWQVGYRQVLPEVGP